MFCGEQIVKEVFKEGTFTENDISKALKISPSKAHYLRVQLSGAHELVRIARGVYTFAKPTFIPISPAIELLRQNLVQLKKQFVFTSATFFHHFFRESSVKESSESLTTTPYELVIMYVEKGTAQLFEQRIEKFGSTYIALVEPELRDFELLKNKAKFNEFIVIRENAYFYSSKDHCASLEKAFVDLYFEITRQKLPLPDKLVHILTELMHHNRINFTTLLKCAHERGIKKEFLELLRSITKQSGLQPKGLPLESTKNGGVV